MDQLKVNISDFNLLIDTSSLRPWVGRELSRDFCSFVNPNGDIPDETLDVVSLKGWGMQRNNQEVEEFIRKCLKRPLDKFPFKDEAEKEIEFSFKSIKSFLRDKRFRSFFEDRRNPEEMLIYPLGGGCLLRKGQPARSALFLKTGFFRGSEIASICKTIQISASMGMPIKGSIMLHGTGIQRQGIGYLFLGLSGDGKTTIARLSPPEGVISDDGIIVERDVSGFKLVHAPLDQSISYLGNSKRYIKDKAGLIMGFFLKKDDNVYLEKVLPSEACCIILKNHIHYFRYFPPKSVENTFSLISDLCRDVPFYMLHFRRDSTFWDVINKEIKKVYSSQETDNGFNKKRQKAYLRTSKDL
jgi:hypothetical protein